MGNTKDLTQPGSSTHHGRTTPSPRATLRDGVPDRRCEDATEPGVRTIREARAKGRALYSGSRLHRRGGSRRPPRFFAGRVWESQLRRVFASVDDLGRPHFKVWVFLLPVGGPNSLAEGPFPGLGPLLSRVPVSTGRVSLERETRGTERAKRTRRPQMGRETPRRRKRNGPERVSLRKREGRGRRLRRRRRGVTGWRLPVFTPPNSRPLTSLLRSGPDRRS